MLVAKRAMAMQRACELCPGTMAAVLNLPNETVEQVCKVSSGKSDRGLCYSREIHTLLKGLALGVYLEYLFSASQIGIAYRDLSVKSTGTEKCGVKYIGAVCRRHNDNALASVKAVHLYKQLIERLLTLVMSASETCASMTADCIYLVYKDDSGGVSAGGLKEIAHTGSTDTNVHLDEV